MGIGCHIFEQKFTLIGTEMFSFSFNVFLDFCLHGLVFYNLTIYPMDYWWNSYDGVVVSLFLFNCTHVGFT